MEIEHRLYLISYHKQSFYGFWKSILENPPCKKPNTPRTKQFSYELEPKYDGKLHELYLHLIGFSEDLDGVEKQLAKFKIARLEPIEAPERIVLIMDQEPDHGAIYMFRKFCFEKNFQLKGKELHRDGRIVKTYR
ncbi:MAG: hypothetical protein ACTSQI_11520 [Candidatus Helarchaeota archaeon]